MNTLDELHSGALRGAKQVQLACGLTAFPRALFELADTLEVLDLSGNALSSLPDDLMRLTRLRILLCSDNQFTALPEVLGRCAQLSMVGFKANQIRTVSAKALPPRLRWLILTDNRIARLPAELGDCAHLQKLMLSGNQLQTLPPELSRCSGLELLRIAANQLTELPDWLWAMPRLSWLAYAGNPLCSALESAARATATLPPIAWQHLRVQHLLGEGASGAIYRAEHLQDAQMQQVAVKIFKGDITSDGLPQAEMTACMAAGSHPGLVPVLGQLTQHPSGANGLVMPLIPSRFRNLAGPPSLQSCTRDVYAPGLRFDLATVARIAHGMACATRHLHQRGILHGDLYAHNILHDEQGQALLGDLGAASLFATDATVQATGLQRLEARAFGYLLEELIERCDESSATQPGLTTMRELKARCLTDNPQSRPLFDEIAQVLGKVVADGNIPASLPVVTGPAAMERSH